MGNASSINSSAVVYLDINGKQEKVFTSFTFTLNATLGWLTKYTAYLWNSFNFIEMFLYCFSYRSLSCFVLYIYKHVITDLGPCS